MTHSLDSLFNGLPGIVIRGRKTCEVSALSTDSRRVVPGTLFFALGGLRTDGHFFIAEAIDRGAVAIVCERDCWVPPHVTLVIASELRDVLAHVAGRFYRHPESSLELCGCMGTSGKTVASHLLHALHADKAPSGLLGTIRYAVGSRSLPAHRTTPEPIELHGLLAQIRDQGCRRAILEVSSHGIHQKRVTGLRFSSLCLLNLTPEHLHYHGSFDNYVRLQTDYIREQAPFLKAFVAGIDDPQVRRFLAEADPSLREKTLTFGCHEDAHFRATGVSFSSGGTRFTLRWPGGEIKLVSQLIGEFNLQNTLAALACGHAHGLEMGSMGACLLGFTGVRGRMERVDAGQPFTLLVDYMHTEASYAKGLAMIRELTEGRLITVFGCGGNRDPRSRPVITKLVSEGSDLAYATADNPRNEKLSAIFADMGMGAGAPENLTFIEDRRSAISEALSLARPGDTVLVAGKGHETFQEFEDCVVPFDDRAVARDILKGMQWQEHR